eukprot:gene27975-33781_t
MFHKGGGLQGVEILGCATFFHMRPETIYADLLCQSDRMQTTARFGEQILQTYLLSKVYEKQQLQCSLEELNNHMERYTSAVVKTCFLLFCTDLSQHFDFSAKSYAYFSLVFDALLVLGSSPRQIYDLRVFSRVIDRYLHCMNTYMDLDRLLPVTPIPGLLHEPIDVKRQVDIQHLQTFVKRAGRAVQLPGNPTLSLHSTPLSSLPIAFNSPRSTITPTMLDAFSPFAYSTSRPPKSHATGSHSTYPSNNAASASSMAYRPPAAARAASPTPPPMASANPSSNNSLDGAMSGHDWSDSKSRHITVFGGHSECSWEGRYCLKCYAFQVYRKYTNRKSRTFLLGLETCPGAPAPKWIGQYRQLLRLQRDVDFPFTQEELRCWGFLEDPNDAPEFSSPLSFVNTPETAKNPAPSALTCPRCGPGHQLTVSTGRCSNKYRCKLDGCSIKTPCRLQRTMTICPKCEGREFLESPDEVKKREQAASSVAVGVHDDDSQEGETVVFSTKPMASLLKSQVGGLSVKKVEVAMGREKDLAGALAALECDF